MEYDQYEKGFFDMQEKFLNLPWPHRDEEKPKKSIFLLAFLREEIKLTITPKEPSC